MTADGVTKGSGEMSKRYFSTLVALAILSALWGAFTYWDRRAKREDAKTESIAEEKLFLVESNQVQSFTIRPREGESVECRREGDAWLIVEPRRLAADASSVSSFLDTLTGARLEEVVEANPSNLKEFGLDPPATVLEFAAAGQPDKLKLLLGDTTPTGGGVYAQVSGNPRVFTLASYVKTSLQKSAFDLRDKRAVTLDVDGLHRIEVQSKGKGFTLVKNPEGNWNLLLPLAVRAERYAVDGLVSQLRTLSMQSVAAEQKTNLAPYGFETPTLRLKIESPAGAETLVVGKKDKADNRYFAMNSRLEPVFTIASYAVTTFQKEPSDLRDKDLFSFQYFEAKRVEVETPQGRRVFEKQQDKWRQTAPAAKDVASDKMESLLNRLTGLRADSFPKASGKDLAAFGLGKPSYKIRVEFGEKNQTEVVEAGKVGEHVYARRSTDLLPSELPKDSLDSIDKALSEL